MPHASSLLVIASAALTAAQSPRITRIEFRPVPEDDGGGVIISLLGSGHCSYTIDYGDAPTRPHRRTARRDAPWYRAITVLARGDARPAVRGDRAGTTGYRAIRQGIWRVTVVPGPSTERPEIEATVGAWRVRVALDFGDGAQQRIEGTLPLKVTHAYAKEGAYELRPQPRRPVVEMSSCSGGATLSVPPAAVTGTAVRELLR